MENNNNSNSNSSKDDEINLLNGIGLIKKIFSFFLIIIALILVLLFVIQKFIDVSYIKKEFNEGIKNLILENSKDNKYESSISINGEVKFFSFIFPHIDINNISVKNIMEDGYYFNSEIKTVRLYISLSKLLLNKKIKILKFNVIDGNLNIKNIDKLEYNLGKQLYNKILNNDFSNKSNLDIIFKNCKLEINNKIDKRIFDQINLKTLHNLNKTYISGKLYSNRQPLKINLLINKKNDIFQGVFNLDSQSFKASLNIEKLNFKNFELSGNSNFDIMNFQLFTRTIFSPSNFLYKKIVDNENLKLTFNFLIKNDIIRTSNIFLDGKNIKGSGNMEFNLDKNNVINFKIESINLDNLIIKNLIGKSKIDEKYITIFNGEESNNLNNNENDTFISKMFKENETIFNIKIDFLKINQNDILNTDLLFSYSEPYKIEIKNIFSNFPGESILKIENKDGFNNISLKGKSFNTFWNFLKNSNSDFISKDQKNNEFELTGNLFFKKNKILLTDSSFIFDNITSNNEAEIFFDSGINLIAIKSEIKNLNLDDLLLEQKDKRTQNDTLKNKILFLSKFEINTLIKFHINEIKYNGFTSNNYNFAIKTSHGILNIYDINLNNKINGSILFNTTQLNPTLNLNLNFNNLSIQNQIDFTKILFILPNFDDIYGNFNINVSNSSFKKSQINTLEINSKIINGIFNLNKFQLSGFGGKCSIQGFLDLKYNKKLNLTFDGCTADLKDTLYLFTNTNNISGLIGFSSVFYTEGRALENFLNNYILKLNLIGNGIVVDNFGLFDLNSDLFKISNDFEFAKSMKTNEILYSKKNKTIFEKLSGSLQYSKKNKGQFNFDISRELINGKINGNFKLLSNYQTKLDMFANFVMLSGTLQKTIPLTLLIQIIGTTPNELLIDTNYKQINDYIESVLNIFEEKNKARTNQTIDTSTHQLD